jgi:PAS domain S-box-containing protein
MAMNKHPWETIVHALGLPVIVWRRPTHGAGELELAYANPAAITALHIHPENPTGVSFPAIMPDASIMPRVGALHETAEDALRSGEARQVRGVSIHYPNTAPQCFHFTFTRVSEAEVAMAGESPHKGYFDKSSDVFGVMDPDGHMLYVTPSAATIFGYTPEELEGDIEAVSIDEADLATVLHVRDFLLSGPHAVRTLEIKRQSKDGTWHDMEIIARDFIDDPSVGGILFNSRDVSQRKAAERRILALNEDLEAFTYTVSHDLRLPLRLVSESLSRTMADAGSALSEAAKVDLAKASDLAGDMTVLIRDLLAFSRTGNAPLERSEVDVSSLAREVLDDLIRPTSSIPDVTIDEGIHCLGDRALLRQVVANLLGNAVKFSQHVAHPRIHLGGHSNSTGCSFFVRDNGIGFEPEQASQLFTVFQRLHQDPSIPGTGIGLSIVKRIVERHGGRVRAAGAPGVGATIHVELPHGLAET